MPYLDGNLSHHDVPDPSVEVVSKQGQLGSKTFYDEVSSVKWMVYGSNQVRTLQ